jgi:hypothetical protein
MISPVRSTKVHTYELCRIHPYVFRWLKAGIGYRGHAPIFRSCRMVGHRDFLVQSLLRPHDLISTLWWSGGKPSWTTNQLWYNPSFLALTLICILSAYRISLPHSGKTSGIPWCLYLANPSASTVCRLFTWSVHHSIRRSSHTSNGVRNILHTVQSTEYTRTYLKLDARSTG